MLNTSVPNHQMQLIALHESKIIVFLCIFFASPVIYSSHRLSVNTNIPEYRSVWKWSSDNENIDISHHEGG